MTKNNQTLRDALIALEWSYPTPEADNDGSCPSCFAGKPLKFWAVPTVRTTEFERKNHMKVCQLADALNLSTIDDECRSPHNCQKVHGRGN